MSSNHNAGHGHVWERPDGMKARCGGPGICRECADDEMRLREITGTMPWSVLDIVMLLRAKDKAASNEREACAKACEAEADITQAPGIAKFGDHYAAIIRARST